MMIETESRARRKEIEMTIETESRLRRREMTIKTERRARRREMTIKTERPKGRKEMTIKAIKTEIKKQTERAKRKDSSCFVCSALSLRNEYEITHPQRRPRH